MNGSFESGPGGSLPVYAGSTALTGWTVDYGSVDSAQGFQAHSGVLSVDLEGWFQQGAISQSVGTTPGQSYLLSFWMAGNVHSGPAVKQMDVRWGGASLGTFTFDTTGYSEPNMGWTLHQVIVQATAAQTTLQFSGLNSVNPGYGPMIDDVSLVLVPEPSSAALLGGGLVALLIRRRRTFLESFDHVQTSASRGTCPDLRCDRVGQLET